MPSHDELVALAVDAAADLEPATVASAFAASLTSRRLDWRSAFGSYAAMRHLKRHAYEHANIDGGQCAFCGVAKAQSYDEARLAKLRAEQDRLVRFSSVEYAAFDLSTFADLKVPPPTDADRAALRDLLEGLRGLKPSDKLRDLDGAIRGTFKSNKGQRRYVLEALGVAGVLAPSDLPSFFDGWVRDYDRETSLATSHHYARDTAWPLQCWKGSDGVNEERVGFWFGHLVD